MRSMHGNTPAARWPAPHHSHLLASLPAPTSVANSHHARNTEGPHAKSSEARGQHSEPNTRTPFSHCSTGPALQRNGKGTDSLGQHNTYRGGNARPPPSVAPDPAALTSWIKSVRSIQTLLRLVRQYGDRTNHIHVSAAVTHLAQLAATESSVAAALAAAATTAADGGRELSTAGAAAIGDADGGTPVGGAAAATPAPADVADARALAESLLLLTRQQLPRFEARQLANTAWALGKWPAGLPGRQQTLADVVQAAGPLLPHFRPQELANLLHGCASCFVQEAAGGGGAGAAAAAAAPLPPAGFLAEHAQACAAQLRLGLAPGAGAPGTGAVRFKMQEMSNLLWAWATLLGSGDDRDAGGGAGSGGGGGWEAAQAGGQRGPPPLRLVVPCRLVLLAQLRLGLGGALPQELANSVWGLARLQFLPPPDWYAAFLEASRRQLVATAAAGTAAATAGGPAPATGPGFRPQELSNLLWAVSKLRLRLPRGWLDAAGPALEACLPGMSLGERVNVLWALAWQAKLFGAAAADEEDGVGDEEPEGQQQQRQQQEPQGQASGADGMAPSGGSAGTILECGAFRQEQSGMGDGLASLTVRCRVLAGVAQRRHTADGEPGASPCDGDGCEERVGSGDGHTGPAHAQPLLAPSRHVEQHCGSMREQQQATSSGSSSREPGPLHRLWSPHLEPGACSVGLDPQVRLHAGPGRPGHARDGEDGGACTGVSCGEAGGRLSTTVLRRVVLSVLDSAQQRPPRQGPDSGPPCTAAGAAAAPHARASPAVQPQDVSMTLWSLATLSYAGLGGTRPSHAAACSAHAPPSSPIAHAVPARSTTPLGGHALLGGPPPLPPEAIPPPHPSSLVSPAESSALLRSWARCLPAMSPQAVSNCVWAAARLGLPLPPELQTRLAAWLRRHAAALAPAEAAAVLRGLGALGPGLATSAGLAEAAAAVLEAAMRSPAAAADGAVYGLWELSQLCYGAAMLLRSMERWRFRREPVPAAAAAALHSRMSLDELDDDAGVDGMPDGRMPHAAAAVPGAVRQQQRQLSQPLERLLLQLQREFDKAGGAAAGTAAVTAPPPPSWGLEELSMTVATVGIVLPSHVAEARGLELATWCEDLLRTHGRRLLQRLSPPYPHVRQLAPLMHAVAAAAVAAARAAHARRAAEAARRRAAAAAALAAAGPRSIVDEFERSGRLADRREELRRQQQHQQQLQDQTWQELSQPGRPTAAAPPPPPPPAPAPPPTPPAPAAAIPKPLPEQLQQPAAPTPPSQPPQAQPQPARQRPQLQQHVLMQPRSAVWRASGLSSDCMSRLWAASQPSLHEASPKEAAMLLWALAVLSIRPPDAWSATLLAAVRPHLRRRDVGRGGDAGADGGGGVSDQTLGVLLYSLGKLRLTPPADWMAAALAEVEVRAAASAAATAATTAAVRGGDGDCDAASASAAAAVGAAAMDSGVVRGVLCGLAELEVSLPAEWLGRVVWALAPQLLDMRPSQRTQTYAALASLDPRMADRLGYEFCELPSLLAARRGGRRGGALGGGGESDWLGGRKRAGGEEGAGQRRPLFSRSRGGWR